MTTMFYSNQKIEECGVSNKVLHTFNRAKCYVVSDLLDKTVEEFAGMRQVGVKTVAEIREFLGRIKDEGVEEVISATEEEEDILARKIDSLEDISVRLKNGLKRAGCVNLGDVLLINESKLASIPNVGKGTIEEILEFKKKQENYFSLMEDVKSLSCKELMSIPFYKEQIVEFVKNRDIPVNSCNFSARVKKRFRILDISMMSQVIAMSDYELDSLEGLGRKSIEETKEVINQYIKDNETAIKTFCIKSSDFEVDEESVRKQILNVFATLGFEGIHLEELMEKLIVPDSFNDERVKYIVGDLINEGKLEYVDYRLYQNYPSFYEYVMNCGIVSRDDLKIITERLDGKTLTEVGDARNCTREWVRQEQNRIIEKIKNAYYKETRLIYFAEDYYKYIFTHYKLEKDKKDKKNKDLEWLGISSVTHNYLKMRYSKEGKETGRNIDVQQAIEDPNVPMQLKMHIYNYNYRDMIYISGKWIKATRGDLEEYVISQFCKEETSFDDFVLEFNRLVHALGAEYEELVITESNKRTRINKIADANNVLWCQGSVLRFYDFGRYDYSELYERLSLEKYTDIEISTNKWFNDYPELMKMYDIRNQYELHNLLKKTINPKDYPNQIIDFNRMPMIGFGNFDKDRTITELLFNYAPIKQNDFVDVIVRELGYDKATTLGSYLRCVAEYFDNGLYVVDYPAMDELNMSVLKNELTEDFYFVKELKVIYKELFPNADEREINAYNLKKMGFLVYSDYVLQNYNSLEEYFEKLILNSRNISEFRKKYGYNQSYYGVLRKLKHSYTILSLSEDEVVTLDQLEKRVGITLDDIKKLCDDVYEFVNTGEFFTIASIRTSGFDSNLFEYGFDDWFFASILSEDERFSFCKKLGTIVLYSGQRNVTFADFVEDRVAKEGSIDVLDLMSDIENIYRIDLSDKYDILPGPESSMFYDKFLDRLYHTVDLYYKEIEEGKS